MGGGWRRDDETNEHPIAAGGSPARRDETGGLPPVPPPPDWQAPPWNRSAGGQGEGGWNPGQGAWTQGRYGGSPPPGQQPGWGQQSATWNQQAQGWGQQYWTAPPAYGNAGRAIGAAVVLLVLGVPAALFGGLVTLVALAAGDDLRDEFVREMQGELAGFDLEAILRVVIVIFGLLLVLGIVQIVAAVGVLLHRSWGRVLGMAVAVLGVLFGLLLVASAADTAGGSMVFALLVLAGYGFIVFALATAGHHFERRSPAAWPG